MGKFLPTVLLPVILLAVSLSAFAQPKLKLTGTVSDSTKPIGFATVRLFKNPSQPPLQTALTKDNGSYELNKPDTGSYTLSFTHTGFTAKQISITVSQEATDMKIDPVRLSKSSEVLGEVVVKSQRPMVEQSDDKIIFNVEDDPASKSETAIDILRKTPFISVDGEDNIKINGKSNFKVLLNGRETSMFARNVKEALRGFPGAMISKIEVITVPSAKYDAEGIGGLINIITKKKIVGYNGTLSTFSRTSDKLHNFNINGNAKVGKFGITAFFNKGFNDPVLQRNTNITIPTVKDAYLRRELDGNQYASSGWSYGNIELAFEIDTLSTISLYTNIDSWNSKTVSNQTITTDFISSPSSISNYYLNNKSDNPGVTVGSDYVKHFKKNKEREFSLRFLGEFGKSDTRLISYQDNPVTDRYLMNNSHALNNQYTIQADNIIPISKSSRIEGGLKGIFRVASSDFQSLIKYDETADYQINPSNTDYFKYRQDVIGIYSMYSLRLKKSSFRFGGRVEHTSVNGNFITSSTKVKNSYTTVIPNIQFTNRINQVTTFVVTYTKRLQRPYIWDLNPFVNNNDSLNISYGNPDLGPQTVHILTTQLRFAKGNTFAGINIEGGYSGNKILQYSFYDPQTGITETTNLNIGKEYQSSINYNFSTKITPKWTININGFFRYLKIKNNSDASQSAKGVGYSFNFFTTYKFSEKFNVSSYTGFFRDPRSIQTTYPYSPWHNVSVNYKVFKNKVNISLRAVNYYERYRYFETITKDKNFYNSNTTRQIRRACVLALTWNFGKLTENVSKKKGVSNDDILSRPAAPGN